MWNCWIIISWQFFTYNRQKFAFTTNFLLYQPLMDIRPTYVRHLIHYFDKDWHNSDVCLGLTLLWNIWGHITTVPACSSGTLTNVLPHRNAMPQTQDMTPHPVTVYSHGVDLSLCYQLMWNVTLEYTATHFNVLGETWPGKSFPNLPHTPANAQIDAVMVVNSRKLSRKYRTNRVLDPGPVVCESSTLSARPQRLPLILM